MVVKTETIVADCRLAVYARKRIFWLGDVRKQDAAWVGCNCAPCAGGSRPCSETAS